MHLLLGMMTNIDCDIKSILTYTLVVKRSLEVSVVHEQCTMKACPLLSCHSGISIEFLCFPRPEEPIERVMSCLQALSTLLECPRARKHIAEDQASNNFTLITHRGFSVMILALRQTNKFFLFA